MFLVHPGGPFFRRRDEGVWSIPKGEVAPGEDPLAVALREFEEETGRPVEACAVAGEARPVELGSVRQRGGKLVLAWCFEGDWPEGDPPASNTFELEWPKQSGRRVSFPEVDRAGMFPLELARRKINPAQVELLERLVGLLGRGCL